MVRKLLLTYILLLFSFTALVLLVHLIPKSSIEKNVVESAILLKNEGAYKKFFGFKLFQLDNFTDACMLNIAYTADDKSPVDAAMMNYYHWDGNCFDMADNILQLHNGEIDKVPRESYGRYWQGYQVTLRPLLCFLNIHGIRLLNFLLLFILAIWCSVLLAKKVGSAVAWIFVASLLLINFPMVPYSMQFSTCFYLMFIGMIAVMTSPILTTGIDNIVATFFAIGGITVFLDFLTTPQLTLGFPLVVMLLMKSLNKGDEKYKLWQLVIIASMAWAFGYALLWASKWIIAYLLTGNNILADAMESAKLRSSNQYKGMEMTIPNIISFIWTNIASRGLQWMVYGGLAVTLLVGLFYYKMQKGLLVLKEYAWLLLVTMMVPVWFLLLRNHSIQHGWFTWRAGLLSLFSLTLYVYYTTRNEKTMR